MTAADPPKIPPRWFVTTFWKGHRLLYRMTGGRWGLNRPSRGRRLGILRLRTTGRVTGRIRAVLLSYYEDGQDLVVLAMNGWGDPEPAWWLNLRAQPDAEVDLVGGSRPVHGREAEGPERERLWAGFADYSPSGEDLDALATLRDRRTSVVILAPR